MTVLEHLLEADEFVHVDPVGAGDPARDRLGERFGLLVDLLEHEVRVAALLGGLGRPVDGRDVAGEDGPGDVGDGHAPGTDVGDIALLEEDDLVRVGQDRGDVRGQEALPVTEPDDQGHILAGTDEPVALAPVHDHDCVGTLDLLERRADRVGEIAGVGLLDEMGDRFGVGLRGERVATRLEAVAQLPEVLDDPVVDDRDLAGAVLVGVRVEVVGPTVRRPAGMGEPDRRVWRPVGDGRLEVGQLAGALLDEQVARIVDEGDPGRVVAAVLQPFEAFDEDGAGLPGTGIPDDAAHSGVEPPLVPADLGRRVVVTPLWWAPSLV